VHDFRHLRPKRNECTASAAKKPRYGVVSRLVRELQTLQSQEVVVEVTRWNGFVLLASGAVLIAANGGQAQECVPDCRDGFVCVKGECVSGCNPPCDEGERCTADGQCIPETPLPTEERALSDGNQELRMANRLHTIFRVGAGGKIEAFDGVDVVLDPRATVGLSIRFEAPVHKVLTTGFVWSLYSFGAVDRDRNLGMDLSPFLKGRYAFSMGAKDIEAEAYAIFQFGLSLANVPDNFGYSSFGAGFNAALAPGFMVFVTDTVGTFFEVGYSYGWARFDGELTGTLGQATMRFGVAFAFH
jgi:hypothetical protein